MKTSLIVLCVAFMLGGCTSNNINRIATDQRVVAPTVMPVDKETEGLVREVFSETGLDWDKEKLAELDICVFALKKEAEYMKSLLNLTGEVPYYECKSSINRTLALTNDINDILQERSETPGAVTNIGKGYYNLLIKDILEDAKAKRSFLAAAEKDINDAATSADMADLENLYNQLAPLIETVGKAL